jgi:apurinic endonuclease APN1
MTTNLPKLILKISPKISPNTSSNTSPKILSNISSNTSFKESILDIGCHISKIDGSVSKSLLCFINYSFHSGDSVGCINLTCQMFLRNPRNGFGDVPNESDILASLKIIKDHQINYFTHSPYIINLSRPFTKKNPTCEKWVLGLLSKDLQTTNAIGGKGVVVHVGKSVDLDIDTALNKMESSIRTVLKDATENCPLLLETPAGEGTELCSTIEQLLSFYQRFSEDERKRFKICVDTCHVFASGYDPLEYMTKWNQQFPSTIALVHFNDSCKSKGSKVDLHKHYIDGGFIGYQKMVEISKWCRQYEIPMVVEAVKDDDH